MNRAQLHNTTAFERISPGTEHRYPSEVSQANYTIQDMSVWSFVEAKHFSYWKRKYKIINEGLFVQKRINIKGICVQKDTSVV